MKSTAVVGASPKPERYSYKAMQMLKEYGHPVHLVSNKKDPIEGHPVYKKLSEISEPIDTVTMYVGPSNSSQLLDDIVTASPKRVIFNPGAENPVLEKELKKRGIQVEHGCTLVMLRAGQF